MAERPDWPEYFLGIAAAVAARGDCKRKQVGSIIVDPADHFILATGYNGVSPGEPGCLAGKCPRAESDVKPLSDYKSGPGRCISIHSEDNAIRQAKLRTGPKGCYGREMYTAYEPCPDCRMLIVDAGIIRVQWSTGPDGPGVWFP